MVTTTQRSRAALDDDDNGDLYDPRYPGKKVVRDGKGIRVPMFLTDGRPDWMPPPTRPALFDYVRDAYRNYAYQPHVYVGDSVDPLAAARSYLERTALRDAYRTMRSGTGGAAKTTAPAADDPGDDDDTMTPRDRYIKRLQTAYRKPPGSPEDDDDAAAIEAQHEAWSSPGATPGPGYGDAATGTATKDAGADRDKAYSEYLESLREGWRR